MNIQISASMLTRLARTLRRNIGQPYTSSFHTLSRVTTGGNLGMSKPIEFLKPTSCTIVPTNTFQSKLKVEKQCPDCYFIWRESRKYVYCKKYPSHNQQTKVPKDKERFIIAGKSHGRIRPW